MDFQLNTPRLILREFSTQDANHFYDLNSNPEVIKYTGDPPFVNIEEAQKFLSNYKDYESNGFGRWAVIEKQTGQFVGWCGLKYHSEGYVDLGFRFFQHHWGKGFATESAQACIQYAKSELNLKRLIGRVVPENKVSINVLEKLGFTFYKIGECHHIKNTRYYKLDL